MNAQTVITGTDLYRKLGVLHESSYSAEACNR
jgi:hypothetical protein